MIRIRFDGLAIASQPDGHPVEKVGGYIELGRESSAITRVCPDLSPGPDPEWPTQDGGNARLWRSAT
jgi:hypothetical protein